MFVDHYQELRVDVTADFADLRRAYRRRAMQCHPDRFGGDRRKADEFRRVVAAFDLLSDPVRRQAYDATHPGVAAPASTGRPRSFRALSDDEPILDTFADDILEELIVGNTVPRGSTLATLMRDLEQTKRFVLFREAKNHFYAGRLTAAEQVLARYLRLAPQNILAHYFLARCHVLRGRLREAERALETACRIGRTREPPMALHRLHRELAAVRRRQPGLLAALRRLFAPQPPAGSGLTPEEEERRALSRAMSRMAAERPLPPA